MSILIRLRLFPLRMFGCNTLILLRFISLAHRTSSLALLLALLISAPRPIYRGGSDTHQFKFVFDLRPCSGTVDTMNYLKHLSQVPAAWALLGAYVGAIPIPYDWERPWQVRFLFNKYTVLCIASAS